MSLKDVILNEMHNITNEGWTDGIVACTGSKDSCSSFSLGFYENTNKHLVVDENTLFDLASVTKLYTLLGICKLIEDGKIDITKKVSDYPMLSSYTNLQELYLYELINFSVVLCTKSSITDCNNKSDIDNCLKNVYIKSYIPQYSDIGVIIFVHMLNTLYGPNFFRENIKKLWYKANMNHTYWFDEIPNTEYSFIQSYDNEYRVDKNGNFVVWNTPIGMVHDPKCRNIGAAGHAGIFTNLKDIKVFCEYVLSKKLVTENTIKKYITNSQYDTFTNNRNQHFGILSYKKTNDKRTSEIPKNASENSIAMSGYTGCYLLLDFEKNKYVFIGSNRLHNRETSSDRNLNNPNILKNTKEYVYRKDLLRDYLYELF